MSKCYPNGYATVTIIAAQYTIPLGNGIRITPATTNSATISAAAKGQTVFDRLPSLESAVSDNGAYQNNETYTFSQPIAQQAAISQYTPQQERSQSLYSLITTDRGEHVYSLKEKAKKHKAVQEEQQPASINELVHSATPSSALTNYQQPSTNNPKTSYEEQAAPEIEKKAAEVADKIQKTNRVDIPLKETKVETPITYDKEEKQDPVKQPQYKLVNELPTYEQRTDEEEQKDEKPTPILGFDMPPTYEDTYKFDPKLVYDTRNKTYDTTIDSVIDKPIDYSDRFSQKDLEDDRDRLRNRIRTATAALN